MNTAGSSTGGTGLEQLATSGVVTPWLGKTGTLHLFNLFDMMIPLSASVYAHTCVCHACVMPSVCVPAVHA